MVLIYDILAREERGALVESMGDRLKWCRRRVGWTQRDLAAAAGVGLATIRRIEQQTFAPRLETVRRLAETLHVRDGWLAFGEAPMVNLGDMTEEEQQRVKGESRPADSPGDRTADSGPWYRDQDAWRIDEQFMRNEGAKG